MQDKILLAHGGGGLLSAELIRDIIQPRFDNEILGRMDDSAVLPQTNGRLAFTSDSFVVSPAFFPGGNIGDLAVCGTVNDLAMSGAKPLHLSLSLILEEGLLISDLEKILDSVKLRCKEAGVSIVCGDTKVVPNGQGDGIYINTAGIGELADGVNISSANGQDGDALIISGPLGLHGLAVMLARSDFKLTSPVTSDVAPLNDPVAALLKGGIKIKTLRDLTRGGLAMALSDISSATNTTAEISEELLPHTDAQKAACEILGLDMITVACEGAFIAVVENSDVENALTILKNFEQCKHAAVVGNLKPRQTCAIEMITAIGSRRVVTPPRGEQMPRIC